MTPRSRLYQPSVSKILHAHLDKLPFLLNFGYRSVIGKLNYLAQTTRPDIVYTTHQLAKYSSDPREPHGEAVLYLICYLKKTWDLGTRFKPDWDKGFECYCNADFFWQLKHASCSVWSKYCQVTQWMDRVLCRMFSHLGIQVVDTSRFVHYWGWIHCHVSITTRHAS